jgi:hypothetical protein
MPTKHSGVAYAEKVVPGSSQEWTGLEDLGQAINSAVPLCRAETIPFCQCGLT